MAKKKDGPRIVESSEYPAKTCKFKVGSLEVELLDSGLEAVHSLMSSKEPSYEKQLLAVVEKIGLAKAMKRIWRWQDRRICEEFIRNWDNTEKRTTVCGIRIDVRWGHFLVATGLNGDNLYCPTIREATSSCRGWKYGKFCGAERERWCSNSMGPSPLRTSDLKNPIMRYLLVLLNKTLWLGSKDPSHLSKAAVYLVVEALEGNMLGWGMYVYERFMSVMGGLQMFESKSQQLLAGPLMCFLYAQARAQVLPCSDVPQISKAQFERSAGPLRKVMEEEFYAADDVREGKRSSQPVQALEPPYPPENSSKKRPRDGVTGHGNTPSDLPTEEPSTSTDQAQRSEASVPPSTPDNPSKKPCRSNSWDMDTDPPPASNSHELLDLTAKVHELIGDLDRKKEEINRLMMAQEEYKVNYARLENLYLKEVKNLQEITDSGKSQQKIIYQLTLAEAEYKKKVTRLEILYADEQKHTKECLQLHFASAVTEDEVLQLRERVKVLKDHCRESSRRESFLELQLADLRRRWDIEFPSCKEGMGRKSEET